MAVYIAPCGCRSMRHGRNKVSVCELLWKLSTTFMTRRLTISSLQRAAAVTNAVTAAIMTISVHLASFFCEASAAHPAVVMYRRVCLHATGANPRRNLAPLRRGFSCERPPRGVQPTLRRDVEVVGLLKLLPETASPVGKQDCDPLSPATLAGLFLWPRARCATSCVRRVLGLHLLLVLADPTCS